MPRRSSDSFICPVSLPSSVMLPEEGRIIRLIMRRDVVLPQPEGPTSTVILPLGASKLRSSTATVPSGNFLVTPSKAIMRINLTQHTDKGDPVDQQVTSDTWRRDAT